MNSFKQIRTVIITFKSHATTTLHFKTNFRYYAKYFILLN